MYLNVFHRFCNCLVCLRDFMCDNLYTYSSRALKWYCICCFCCCGFTAGAWRWFSAALAMWMGGARAHQRSSPGRGVDAPRWMQGIGAIDVQTTLLPPRRVGSCPSPTFRPGCPGRGSIVSDAAWCSNGDCSQILPLPTPGRAAHDTLEVGSPKHFLAHLFDLGDEGHTTVVRYAQERRRRGTAWWDPVDCNFGSPLCLSVVQTEESYFGFCSNEGQARLLAPAYYLVDFGLLYQGDIFFLTAASG